jgi:hypothetical protein
MKRARTKRIRMKRSGREEQKRKDKSSMKGKVDKGNANK